MIMILGVLPQGAPLLLGSESERRLLSSDLGRSKYEAYNDDSSRKLGVSRDSGDRSSFLCRGVRRQQADPDRGNVVTWRCEGATPGQLTRQGFRHGEVKIGDKFVVDGYAAKDGAHLMNARR